MDIQALSNLFNATLSPDPNARKAAELEIRKVARQEGVLAALMQIIGNEGVDAATRQSCSVYLKNRLRRTYHLDPTATPTGDQNPILPADRAALKANIIPLLIATAPSKQIHVQIANGIRSIISVDFPDDWPNLLGDTKRLLTSSNIRDVETGLVVLLEIIKAFRYRQTDRVTPKIIEETFPMLVTIGLQLLDSPPAPLTPQSPEIPYLLHLILKSYKCTLVTNLTAHQQSAASIVPWGQLFFRIINLQIPPEALPSDEDDRERCEWWKAKKWAYSSLDRLFHRFGSPSQLPTPLKEYMPFAEHFISTFAPEMIRMYLRQLDLYTSGQVWMSKKCQYLIFQFLTECVKPKSTWALMKDHVERLVSNCVFPQFCFNDTRKELWESDPVDFVRSSTEEYEDYDSPVSSSCNFLMSLARNRTKTSFLPILSFINNVLRNNPTPEQRYGALSMASLLAPCMVRHPDVKPALETFFVNHVLPAFSMPEGYLRYIACRVVSSIEKCDMTWTDENNLSQHYLAIMKMIDDAYLPTRVAAVDALSYLIERQPSVEAAVKPAVGKVVQDVLRLSDETDLEMLNSVMETMVKHYATELLPVATQLTERLCQLYQRLVKETLTAQPDDDDDITPDQVDFGDDKTYAAMGMCKTIQTIVTSLDSSPEIIGQLQDIIAQIIIFTLENLALDLLTNIYDLVDSLTFSVRRISPAMWPIFELTYKLFKSDAEDFLEEMLPTIDNYISFGKDTFVQRPDYRAMAVDIYKTAMSSVHLGDSDRVNGTKVAESLLLNLRGYLDDAIPTFVTCTLQCIDSNPTTRYLRINNVNVLVNCILYNSGLTLQLLQAQNGTQKFFENWFSIINTESGMPRVHAKKLTILAICALFETDPAVLPQSIRDGWGSIMAGVLKTLREMPAAVEARKALFDKHAKEDDEEEEEYVDDLNLDGDADADVWDADSEYMEFLAKEGQRLRDKETSAPNGIDEDEEEEDEDEGDDDWADDEIAYISPIDNVDIYVSFKNSLEAFQMKNPAGYATATSSLNVEMQTVMMETMARAQSATL